MNATNQANGKYNNQCFIYFDCVEKTILFLPTRKSRKNIRSKNIRSKNILVFIVKNTCTKNSTTSLISALK